MKRYTNISQERRYISLRVNQLRKDAHKWPRFANENEMLIRELLYLAHQFLPKREQKRNA